MKVLIIHCFYNYKGGEDIVVEQEFKSLQEQGIQVELLAFNNSAQKISKLAFMPFNLGSYKKTVERIRQLNPDIVHVHNLHFGASPSVIYAIKKCKVPYVMTLHNYRLLCPTAFLFYKGKPFTNSLKHFFPWRAIANRVFHNSMLATFWLSVTIKSSQWLGTWKTCSRYIVFNKYAKDIFLQQPSLFNAAKFVIKPNFCFPAYGNVLSAIREQFLYIGRLSEEKGISVLLDVFIKVPYRIKIAGAGPLKEKVMRYARCFKNIEYVGEVAKENVAIIMQASTALIFPSVWHEGMPLTIIEAFAAGLPVISSNMGAMAQMIQHQYNGLHFKPGNEFDLITRLDQWQGLSFDERNHYRENALTTYESNYDPAVNVQELIQIYSSVLADDGDLPLATTQHINYTPTILNRVAE